MFPILVFVISFGIAAVVLLAFSLRYELIKPSPTQWIAYGILLNVFGIGLSSAMPDSAPAGFACMLFGLAFGTIGFAKKS